MTSPNVATILTVVIVTFWVIGAIVRIWQPWPPGIVLDAAMPTVVGYWFISNSTKKPS